MKLEDLFAAVAPLNQNTPAGVQSMQSTMCSTCGKNTITIACMGSCYECIETFPVERMEQDIDLA